jgi:hypothetical protein
MRTEVLLNNVDASVQQIGTYQVDCGQDMRWLLIIKSIGLDGTPRAYLEESINGSDWVAIVNNEINSQLDYFPINDPLESIRDSYFMGRYFRLRVEPQNNTTGTITAELGIKTKSV